MVKTHTFSALRCTFRASLALKPGTKQEITQEGRGLTEQIKACLLKQFIISKLCLLTLAVSLHRSNEFDVFASALRQEFEKGSKNTQKVCFLTTETLVTYLNVGLQERKDMLTYGV